MLVAVASRKASPGVTTLASLVAAQWPGEDATRLILEADPSGGTLAARWSGAHGVSWDPGLLTLSTTRRRLDRSLLAAVAQPVADRLWLAAAPPGADQVAGALTRLGETGAAALADAEIVTIADCGRLTSGSPAMNVARRASLTLLVCRPRLDEVHGLVPAVEELRAAGCRLGLVTVGRRPYKPTDVAASLGIDLVGVLADDPGAAERFEREGFTAGRAFTRSALAGTAAEVTAAVWQRHGSAADAMQQRRAEVGAPQPPLRDRPAPTPPVAPTVAPPPSAVRPVQDRAERPPPGSSVGPAPLPPPHAGSAMPLSPAVAAARSLAASAASGPGSEVDPDPDAVADEADPQGDAEPTIGRVR